jgi:hypothetical protein
MQPLGTQARGGFTGADVPFMSRLGSYEACARRTASQLATNENVTEEGGDLVNAIAALRADLQDAMHEGQGKSMQFGLGDIELTLQLVAEKHGGGKIGWSILGVDAGVQSERTHIVKLTLKPQHLKADGTYTADFTITDQVDVKPGVSMNRT